VGESLLPLAARTPWMLSVNCFVISGWHPPQVWGILDRKIEDFGSVRDLQVMTPMATGTGHLSRFSMDTLLKLLFRYGLPQSMLFDKGHIRMTASTCLVDIRNVDH
jgi:hypothetical protein